MRHDVLCSVSPSRSTMLPARNVTLRLRANSRAQVRLGPSSGSAPSRSSTARPHRFHSSGNATKVAPASTASPVSFAAVARLCSLSGVEHICTAATRMGSTLAVVPSLALDDTGTVVMAFRTVRRGIRQLDEPARRALYDRLHLGVDTQLREQRLAVARHRVGTEEEGGCDLVARHAPAR